MLVQGHIYNWIFDLGRRSEGTKNPDKELDIVRCFGRVLPFIFVLIRY